MEAAFVWLVALMLRSTVVLTAALALAWLLRRSSAAPRHRLLTLTALGLLALPALPIVLPRLGVPLGFLRVEAASPTPAPAAPRRARMAVITITEDGYERSSALPAPWLGALGAAPPAEGGDSSQRGVSSQAAFGAALVPGVALPAVAAWLIGIAAALMGLGRALLRERRLLASARIAGAPWLETLDEARRACGVAHPVRLLVSDAIESPLTGGWLRPAVLLPSIAGSWTAERRRLVLQHELVHVARRDGLRRLAWRLVAALYWFHPLARIAKRQAALIGEQACDEAVLRLGAQPSLYARHLMEIAEALRGRPAAFASALRMVERNQLERRIVMILDVSRSTRRGRGLALAALALLATTVLGAAAVVPAAAACAAPAQEPERSQTTAIGTETQRLDSSSSTKRDQRQSFQHDFGNGYRLSVKTVGDVGFDERTGALRDLPRGSSVLIETRELGRGSQRMLIAEEEGEARWAWWPNGDARQPVDDVARAWLKEALEVFAAYRAIGGIRGYVGSLQGQIGSIQGQIGSLQGQIGSIQGEEGSLQGKIGAIQGEQGHLQGEIGSHLGAIGSLQSARSTATGDLKRRLDEEIEQHEAAIRKLEAKLEDGTLERRLAEAEAELRAFQRDARERIQKIAAIQSKNEVAEIERKIESVRAEERVGEIERRVAPAVERLQGLIRKLGG